MAITSSTSLRRPGSPAADPGRLGTSARGYGGFKTGQGAIPGEVMLASLVGCQAMVARLWFRQNRIEYQGVEVEVVGDGPVDMLTGAIALEFDVEMRVDAELSDDQLGELRAFVDQMCMVGTTIRQENPVHLKVVRA